MSDHSVNSSDLERARARSRRLWAAANPTSSEARRGKHHYVRFSASAVKGESFDLRLHGGGGAERPGFAESAELPPTPERGFQSWLDALRWCREGTAAEVCFLVDPQGFVLEYDGTSSYDQMEDLGSQLTVILSRADQVESAAPARSVTLSYDGLFLTGVRVVCKGPETLTVAIVSRTAVRSSAPAEIAARLRESAEAF